MSTPEHATPSGAPPRLQDALDRAGSAVNLLWKPHAPTVVVPEVPPEYSGWREEQRAYSENVALLELSHHMVDLYIDGPDASRLLASASANNYEKFAVGQAKQLITVSHDGWLIQDAIVARRAQDQFTVTGIGTAHNWIAYHASNENYDVELAWDPSSDLRGGANPRVFRLQIQGPSAMSVLKPLFGDQLEGIPFFHFRSVSLEGRRFDALRHGMAGQPGFEFIGPWEHAEFVKNALLNAGEAVGMQQVGGRAYYASGVDSGWLATPVPGIYSSPEEQGFREFTSLFSYEGMNALQGSFYSPNIEDYYVNPYELGYGRSIHLNHDFVGREALSRRKEEVQRTKVTLVWNREDVDRVFGRDGDLVHTYTHDRVEVNGELVGLSEYTASSASEDTVHSIARIDKGCSTPGTEVTVLWGQHPGPSDPEFSDFERIRATVHPSPYEEYARTGYRGKSST